MENNKLVFQSSECLGLDEIRLYLKGDLDETERYRVENHLIDCPLCSDAVEGFAGEYNFDENNELDELKEVVKLKINTPSELPKSKFFTLNRIAAAIVFLIISAATIFYWNAQKQEKSILAEIQSSNNILENVRGVDEIADKQYSEGVELFQEEKFQESLFFFEKILEAQPENPTANYFSGISALNLGEFEKAIEQLTFARFNSEKYYEDATWHLVMANVGKGEKAEAIALLNDLLKIEGGFYTANAEKLKNELEKN